MGGMHLTPKRLLALYGVIASALWLLAFPLSWVHPEVGAFRNWQIGLNAIFFWFFLGSEARDADAERRVPGWVWGLVTWASAVWFFGGQLCRYYSFSTNGIDFSIFDWMLVNTNRGHFGYSPIYDVNHFGVHASYVLLLWAPVHRVLESPLVLVVSNPVLLWAAIFPLRRLVRGMVDHEGLELLAVVAYLSNPWVGRLIDGGFRPENLYPLVSFVLILGWVRKRAALWGPALVFFLAIKEDAALWGLCFAAGVLLFERKYWRGALTVAAASGMTLAVNLVYLRPLFLAGYETVQPTYLRFWGQYGDSLGEIAWHVLTSPLRVGWDVVRSGWYKLFGAALFLPLLSRVPLAVLVGMGVVFGSAQYAAMREYRAYYAVPLIAFLFWGMFEAHSHLSRIRTLAGQRIRILACALLVFPLIGGGYLKFSLPSANRLRDFERVKASLAPSTPVCAQAILFPYLPYSLDLALLGDDCVRKPGAVALVNPELDPFPLTRARLEGLVQRARAKGLEEEPALGFHLLRDPELGVGE